LRAGFPCCQVSPPFSRCCTPLRRILPILSRTMSPWPAALLPFPRRAARTSRGRVAAPAVQSASRCERRLQGFAPRLGLYHRAPFPASDGLSSRGLLVPLQGPSIASRRLRGGSRRTGEPPPRTIAPFQQMHTPVGTAAAQPEPALRRSCCALFRCPPAMSRSREMGWEARPTPCHQGVARADVAIALVS
jgi:hypothetical protein